MPKLYDRTYGVTEDELIRAAKENSWTVGDVLSAYTGQIKLFRIFEELEDNGDIRIWANDNSCSEDNIKSVLMESFDEKANLHVYGHLRDVDVRCTMSIGDYYLLYFFISVAPSNESLVRLESRIRKLEKLLKL